MPYQPCYDYHAHFEDSNKTESLAKKLGWSGLCLVANWTNHLNDLEKFKKSIEQFKEVKVALGIEIKDKPNRIPELVSKIRGLVEVVLIHGGDPEVNRISVETPEVDILLHPESNQENSGLDYTMVKLAKKNNVAIEFSLSDLVQNSALTRSRLLRNLIENAKLVRKYKVPFVLTSGAFDYFGLRSPFELLSFGRVLGFQDPEIKKALSDSIIKENKKRLSGKWVMPGVEIID